MEPGKQNVLRDGELVEALVGRDQTALATLYDRFGSTLFALSLRVLGNTADAEETLTDVFMEFWRRPDRFDRSRGTLLAYLITLTRSRAIDRLRSRRRGPSRVSLEGTDRAPELEDPAVESPFEGAVSRERRERIRQALRSLTTEQREAVELSFYSGMSHGEIAETLKQPLGTVKSRIRGGLIQLRSSLRSLYGSDEAS